MKNNRNIKLKSYDDIFNIQDMPSENDIKHIDIDMLDDFCDHPFKVTENKEMDELLESIKENGILVPLIVRPLAGRYEMISGHRRKYCAKKAGLETAPCIINDIDYDAAIFAMIDSNIQRKNILPSEKAFSYKLKLNAIKRQGERRDLTCRQVIDESETESTSSQLGNKSATTVGKDYNDSTRSVYRYIRLTELIPFLLDAVDNKKLSTGAGVEISHLSKEEQEILTNIIKNTGRFLSFSQAKQIRSMAGKLSEDNIKNIILGSNHTESKRVITIDYDEIKSFFPEEYTEKDIELEILRLVKDI